jgi:hypothetical protein
LGVTGLVILGQELYAMGVLPLIIQRGPALEKYALKWAWTPAPPIEKAS